MGRDIENNTARQVTFSKNQAGILRKADALAGLFNVTVAVLINSPDGIPYTYGSPSFNEVIERFQNPYQRRERSSLSLKQIRILKSQAILDNLMKELEHEKEREMVLKKRLEKTLERCGMKEVIPQTLNLEELVILKKKLECNRDIIKSERMEKEASSSQLNLPKNKRKNKKKI